MDGGAWQAMVHRVAQSWTRLKQYGTHAQMFIVKRRFSCLTACEVLVSRPGIKPVSPDLEGRFLSTGPLGKFPALNFFLLQIVS